MSEQNKDRTRNYGKRVGDTVSSKLYKIEAAEVIFLYATDNNCIRVKTPDGKERDVVAEYAVITTKVEDK